MTEIREALDNLAAFVTKAETVGKHKDKDPLEEILEAKRLYKQAVKIYGEAAISKAIADLVKVAGPELSYIEWRQYTPYFNDGDACIFSVHEIELYFGGEEMDYMAVYSDEYQAAYKDGGWAATRNITNIYNPLGNAVNKLNATFATLEPVLEETFGDHVKVRYNVESEEFELNDIDHD